MRIESIELRNYRLFRHAKLTALPYMVTLGRSQRLRQVNDL